MAKLWWQRAVSGAGRAGGRKWGGGNFPLSCPPWRFSTDTFVILPSYHLTTLQLYHLTTLPPYHLTTLQPYNLTTLQPYNLTTLQPYHLTTWPPDHQEKKCQWKKRSMSSALLHVLAGDSVLLCSVHIIVLSYMIVAYYIIMWYINYRALIALIFLYNCSVMVFLPQILKTLSLSQCISLFAGSIYRCWSFFCNMLLGDG